MNTTEEKVFKLFRKYKESEKFLEKKRREIEDIGKALLNFFCKDIACLIKEFLLEDFFDFCFGEHNYGKKEGENPVLLKNIKQFSRTNYICIGAVATGKSPKIESGGILVEELSLKRKYFEEPFETWRVCYTQWELQDCEFILLPAPITPETTLDPESTPIISKKYFCYQGFIFQSSCKIQDYGILLQ